MKLKLTIYVVCIQHLNSGHILLLPRFLVCFVCVCFLVLGVGFIFGCDNEWILVCVGFYFFPWWKIAHSLWLWKYELLLPQSSCKCSPLTKNFLSLSGSGPWQHIALMISEYSNVWKPLSHFQDFASAFVIHLISSIIPLCELVL